MIIAITGHTKGIGKELDLHYQSVGIETKTYSRSSGHDIADFNIRNYIVNNTMDCNVFINNAYDPVGQNDLANAWFKAHKDLPHLLINISSIAPIADSYLDLKARPTEYVTYCTQKSKLDKISWDINFSGCAARCINVSPALVDTEMAFPIYIDKFRKNNTVIKPNELASMIADLIDQFFTKKWFVPHVYLLNNDVFD
jgi:hypothetical protein